MADAADFFRVHAGSRDFIRGNHDDPAERQQRFDTLKNVYSAASGAVHSGRVKKTGEKLLSDGHEICRLAILKRLRSGQEPVWKDIVCGR